MGLGAHSAVSVGGTVGGVIGVGVAVGVGATVGAGVGVSVGTVVDATVGEAVGSSVGEACGAVLAPQAVRPEMAVTAPKMAATFMPTQRERVIIGYIAPNASNLISRR
jgi:hypothetical protein